NKYALILSCHSDGVIGKTLLRDENPEISLTLPGLASLLKNALKKKSDGDIQKLELLGFDGCLMGMLEAGYEFRDVAKVMVASEGNIPSSGWPYESVLSGIRNHSEWDGREFGESIVDAYADFNADYAVSGRSVNISASNLETLEGYVEEEKEEDSIYSSVQKLAKILYEILDSPIEAGPDVTQDMAARNMFIKQKFVEWITLSHYRSQTFMHGQAIDIVDFMYNLLLTYQRWSKENEMLLGNGLRVDISTNITGY